MRKSPVSRLSSHIIAYDYAGIGRDGRAQPIQSLPFVLNVQPIRKYYRLPSRQRPCMH